MHSRMCVKGHMHASLASNLSQPLDMILLFTPPPAKDHTLLDAISSSFAIASAKSWRALHCQSDQICTVYVPYRFLKPESVVIGQGTIQLAQFEILLQWAP